MILKYKNDQTWFYEDRVTEISNRHFMVDELINKYDREVEQGMRSKDFLSYCNDADTLIAGKCFYAIVGTEVEGGIPTRFLIKSRLLSAGKDDTVNLIIVTRECGLEPKVGIVTNQPAFLLNDAGKTIEHLV
jgi:hypothetical protein